MLPHLDRQECRNRLGDFCEVEKLIANKDGKRLFLKNVFLCNYSLFTVVIY